MIEFDSRKKRERRKTPCFIDPDRRSRSDRRGKAERDLKKNTGKNSKGPEGAKIVGTRGGYKMGEAKSRGTFEQRKAAALKRNDKAVKLKNAHTLLKEREKVLLQTAMTQEEKQRQFQTRVFISMLQGIAAQARKTK